MINDFFKKGRLDTYADLNRFSVYIHVPFCVRRCRYCAFFSTTFKTIPESQYVQCLLDEAALRAPDFTSTHGPRTLRTLYFGGGTPTRLSDHAITTLVDRIQTQFGRADEVTLECNPEHVSAQRARAWKAAGITRVSLGIQSFDDQMLQMFGRGHNREQALRAVDTIFDAGIPEISIDLIYGAHLDGRDPLELWTAQLDQAKRCGPQHVSCYALTLEPHTPLDSLQKRGQKILEDDDTLVEMMKLIPDQLGMRQYEISNYALENCFSAHNTSCWAGEYYMGLGPGAHSFWKTDQNFIRRANLANVQKYLENVSNSSDAPTDFVESLSPQLHLAEALICAARTRFCWAPNHIAQRVGADITPYLSALDLAQKRGYLRTFDDKKTTVYQTTPLGVQFNNLLDEILFEPAPEH